MRTTTAFICWGVLVGSGAAARAQDAPRPTTGFRGYSFFTAAYTSAGAYSAYGARRVGVMMLVAGAKGNRRDGTSAGFLGSGTQLRLGRALRLTAVLGAQQGNEGTSVRAFLLPAVRSGRLTLGATVAAERPLDSRPATVIVYPVTATWRAVGGLRLGAAGLASLSTARGPRAGIGVAAVLRVPGGRFAVQVLRRDHPWRTEVRSAFSAAL